MKNGPVIAAGVALAIVAGVAGYTLQQQHAVEVSNKADNAKPVSPDAVIGQKRPEFSLSDRGGVMRSVNDWDGKVLVINFWATWCPPCREEIPAFMKLQDQYADQGLQFIGIALQTADEVQEFVAELGINYPILVGQSEVIKVAEQFGNSFGALPYTVLIDREGMIRFVKAGPLHYDEAEAQIKSVL